MSVHCCAMLCIPVSGHHQLAVSIPRAEDGAHRCRRCRKWSPLTIHRTARWRSPQYSSLSASHELYLDTGHVSMSSVLAASRCLAQVAMFQSLNRFLYVFLHLLMEGLSDVTKFMT
jgi:hypothetical protein